MAAASYTTDLTDISLADSTTNWTAIGTGAISVETDYFIQGAGCISKVGWTAATRGQIFNNGAGITIPTDGGIFAWITYNNPNLMDTEANGGMQIIVGSGTAAYRHWYVRGSDTHQYGGWGCYVCNPDAVTQDLTTGSPTGTKQYIGGMAKILGSGSLKGNPFGVDAMRYGRGDTRLTGGDLANGYATIAAAASYANDISRRWGLLYERDGAYFQQGLLSFGQDGTAVDFRDSNRTVFILNTKKVSANFNKWEVRNASSRVDLTNFTVTTLGTVSKGGFEAVANADVNIDTCTFNDMNAFAFLSNSAVLSTTFRRCGIVTLGGGTFDGCTFDKASGTTAVTGTPAQVALVTNSEFLSDGTGHAIEITGTAASLTLTNVAFTGYAGTNGSTGNEAIYVNIASGSVTINISGGSTPTYRTAGATVTVVSSATKTFTGLPSGTEVRVRRGSKTLATDGNVTTGSYVFSYTPDDKPASVQFTLPGYIFEDITVTLNATNQELPIVSAPDPSYSAT